MDKASLMAFLRQAIATGEQKGPGRGTGFKSGLLDDSDLNIGNGVVIVPFGPSSGFATIIPRIDPDRILALDGYSPVAQTCTLALSASTVLQQNVSQQNPVPITVIIEFGNGNAFTRIEVDVPVGRVNAINTVLQAPEDGVVYVTVPAGTLRIYARNDSLYITPNNNGLVGNHDVTTLTPPVSSGNPANALVKASVVYYPLRAGINQPTRTYYIGVITAADTITYTNDPAQAYTIPPLAKRFKLLRAGGNLVANMMAYTGSIYDAAGNILENFSVAAGANSPWFDLSGTAHRIGIAMILTGAGASAELVFEIEA